MNILFERYIKSFDVQRSNGSHIVTWTQRAVRTGNLVALSNVFRDVETGQELVKAIPAKRHIVGLPRGLHPHFAKQVLEVGG